MKIWLDDLRDPKKGKEYYDYVWIKSPEVCMDLVKRGYITDISFDHDLGVELTGYDVAKHIEGLCYYKLISCPRWNIHSANPVGRANIEAAMKSAEKYSNK